MTREPLCHNAGTTGGRSDLVDKGGQAGARHEESRGIGGPELVDVDLAEGGVKSFIHVSLPMAMTSVVTGAPLMTALTEPLKRGSVALIRPVPLAAETPLWPLGMAVSDFRSTVTAVAVSRVDLALASGHGIGSLGTIGAGRKVERPREGEGHGGTAAHSLTLPVAPDEELRHSCRRQPRPRASATSAGRESSSPPTSFGAWNTLASLLG